MVFSFKFLKFGVIGKGGLVVQLIVLVDFLGEFVVLGKVLLFGFFVK